MHNLVGEYSETEILYRYDSAGNAIPTARRDRKGQIKVGDTLQAYNKQQATDSLQERAQLRGMDKVEASATPYDATPMLTAAGIVVTLIIIAFVVWRRCKSKNTNN